MTYSIVAEGLVNSFREGDDYEGFKLATIVNFSIDTQITQEEFLKGDVSTLSEKLYQEATQNYENKLSELRSRTSHARLRSRDSLSLPPLD